MKIFLFLLLFGFNLSHAQYDYEYYDYETNNTDNQTTSSQDEIPSLFSRLSNTTESPVPEPPSLKALPSLEVLSSILNATNTLSDIKSKFEDSILPYSGTNVVELDDRYFGIWWRFYSQNSKLFDIPAVSEEMLIIETNGKAIWLQNIKTSRTLQSQSQRLLRITKYNLFGHNFIVFHYADQDPKSQKIRDKQGYFIRILPDQDYLQISKSPNFEPDQSIYWKRFPKPVPKNMNDDTNETYSENYYE